MPCLAYQLSCPSHHACGSVKTTYCRSKRSVCDIPRSQARCTYKYNHGELLNTGSRTCILRPVFVHKKTRQCAALAICLSNISCAMAVDIINFPRIIFAPLDQAHCAPVFRCLCGRALIAMLLAGCAFACDLYEGRALLVVGTLVLKPLPVASNAGNFLAVEVGHCQAKSAYVCSATGLCEGQAYLGCQSNHWRGQRGSS